MPPISELRYPENQLKRDGDVVISPAIRETPAFTSTSKIPLIAKGYDQDGSLEVLKFFADGKWLSAYTGFLQVTGTPMDGETFTVNDGVGTTVVF